MTRLLRFPFNAIAIESSGTYLSVAIARKNRPAEKIHLNAQWKHEEIFWKKFPVMLKKSGLKLGQVDFFGVTRGPGRFTGVRLGLGVIRTWAGALGKRVFAPTTLELLAWKTKNDQRTILSAFSGAFIATAPFQKPKSYASLEEFFKKTPPRSSHLVYYAQPNLEESILQYAGRAGFSMIQPVIPHAFDLLQFAQESPRKSSLWYQPPKLPIPLYLKQNWPFIS